MTRIAQIVSTSRYLPVHRVGNDELTARFSALGMPDVINKFAASTGIAQRFYAPDDWATSDLALPASQEALKRAGLKPEDVDLIVLGTDSPDYITPDTSVVLQYKLGAKNAGTFDVGCACALKDILAVSVPDQPGNFHRLTSALAENNITVLEDEDLYGL